MSRLRKSGRPKNLTPEQNARWDKIEANPIIWHPNSWNPSDCPQGWCVISLNDGRATYMSCQGEWLR